METDRQTGRTSKQLVEAAEYAKAHGRIVFVVPNVHCLSYSIDLMLKLCDGAELVSKNRVSVGDGWVEFITVGNCGLWRMFDIKVVRDHAV